MGTVVTVVTAKTGGRSKGGQQIKGYFFIWSRTYCSQTVRVFCSVVMGVSTGLLGYRCGPRTTFLWVCSQDYWTMGLSPKLLGYTCVPGNTGLWVCSQEYWVTGISPILVGYVCPQGFFGQTVCSIFHFHYYSFLLLYRPDNEIRYTTKLDGCRTAALANIKQHFAILSLFHNLIYGSTVNTTIFRRANSLAP